MVTIEGESNWKTITSFYTLHFRRGSQLGTLGRNYTDMQKANNPLLMEARWALVRSTLERDSLNALISYWIHSVCYHGDMIDTTVCFISV